MLEAVLNHVNVRARIAVSGMISQYNQVHHLVQLNTSWPGSNSERLKTFLPPLWSLHAPICKLTCEVYLLPVFLVGFLLLINHFMQVWTEREGVRNLLNIVGKEVRIEGYLMGSHMDRFDDFTKAMVTYTKEGKLRSKHKIYYGIESFIESLGSIFSSSNIGKVVIQVKP